MKVARPARAVARLSDLVLPRSAAGRRLAAGAAIDSLGSGMFLASATLYFVGTVHLPAAQVGAALSAASVFGLLSPVPVARLADRIGPTKVYVLLLALRGVGYASYCLVDSLWPYAVLTCVLTGLDRACSPLQQLVVGLVSGRDDRTRTMASIRSVRNVGLTGGLALAGAVLALHHRAAFTGLFLANALSFWAIALVIERLRRRLRADAQHTGEAAGEAAEPKPEQAGGQAVQPVQAAHGPLRDLRFMILTVCDGVFSLHDSVLLIFLPVWVVTRTDAPPSMVSVFLTVNTVLTVVLQVYVVRFAGGIARAQQLVLATLVSLLLACALFAWAEHLSLWFAMVCIALAVTSLTVGENLHSVAAWDLSYELAPRAFRSRYLAVFSLGMSGEQIVGPLLMTAVLLPLGEVSWVVLAVVFTLAALGIRSSVGVRPRVVAAAAADGGPG